MSKSLKRKSFTARVRNAALAVTMCAAVSASAASGTAGHAVPMTSGGVDSSVDAIAVLEANRGYRGRVLGPAAPGAPRAASTQIVSGQYVAPAALVNPISTINRSINSDGVGAGPAILSGADAVAEAVDAGDISAAMVAEGLAGSEGVTAGAVTAGATALSNGNFGVTGVSNVSASIPGTTTGLTNLGAGTGLGVSTGLAAAPAIASNVLATRTLGTAGRLNVDLTAAARTTAPATSAGFTVNNNGLATTRGGVVGGTVRNNAVAARSNAVSIPSVRVMNSGGRFTVTNSNATASPTSGSTTSGTTSGASNQ